MIATWASSVPRPRTSLTRLTPAGSDPAGSSSLSICRPPTAGAGLVDASAIGAHTEPSSDPYTDSCGGLVLYALSSKLVTWLER